MGAQGTYHTEHGIGLFPALFDWSHVSSFARPLRANLKVLKGFKDSFENELKEDRARKKTEDEKRIAELEAQIENMVTRGEVAGSGGSRRAACIPAVSPASVDAFLSSSSSLAVSISVPPALLIELAPSPPQKHRQSDLADSTLDAQSRMRTAESAHLDMVGEAATVIERLKKGLRSGVSSPSDS